MSIPADPVEARREPSDAEVSRWLPQDGAVPDLASLQVELRRQLADERGALSFLRSRSTSTRLALLAFTLLLLAGLVLLLGARVDLALYPRPRLILSSLLIATLFVSSSLLALWPLSLWRVPAAMVTSAVLIVPSLLATMYALPAAHEAHSASLLSEGGDALLESALSCWVFGGVSTMALVGVLCAMDRGGVRRGGFIALAASVASNLLLQLHCPLTASTHLLLGHLGVVLGALLVNALITLRARLRPSA